MTRHHSLQDSLRKSHHAAAFNESKYAGTRKDGIHIAPVQRLLQHIEQAIQNHAQLL